MDDIMKKTTITFTEGGITEKVIIGKIDTTHFYFKRISWSDDKLSGELKTVTDEDIRNAWIYHIGQLSGHPLYAPIWDWLRGLREIEGLEVMA